MPKKAEPDPKPILYCHNQFLEMDIDALKETNSVVFDIKGFLPQTMIDARL